MTAKGIKVHFHFSSHLCMKFLMSFSFISDCPQFGKLPFRSPFHAKEDNFCNFQIASHHKKILLSRDQLLKGRIVSWSSKFFPLNVVPY